ncbi:MAG: hypothetical protein JSV03_17745 [Planctomycetota bacterium]|nr:MAG: hypothetical protein JSV03_17745 [Planctomycetota bacterium]
MTKFSMIGYMRITIMVCLLLTTIQRSRADLLRYADDYVEYNEGPGAQPGYTDPSKAVGQPSIYHSIFAPDNGNPYTGEQTVLSLGQSGYITLKFNHPVLNQPLSTRNPFGYDLLIWGNTFLGYDVLTPDFEPAIFQEQGFVEVAQTDEQGAPIEWYLILPRIFQDDIRPNPVPRAFTPDELLQPTLGPPPDYDLLAIGDLSISTSRFDGFADCNPARGSALATIISSNNLDDVILDDPRTYDPDDPQYKIEGLGGTGIDLNRAVVQSSPGIPAMNGNHFQFVQLDHIDLLRITDARSDDIHPYGLGPITTEIDGVIVLPYLIECNEPFADVDGDGDVDQEDFGLWQLCTSGEGNIFAGFACACFDRDYDGDVDITDFDAFQACRVTSGPNVPADPMCDGP